MYPFKTNIIDFQTHLSSEEIYNYLKKKILSTGILKLESDEEFYGIVNSNNSKFYLGQFPSKNAFRPIVRIDWKQNNSLTDVYCYLRLDYRIIIFFLSIPLSGAFIAIQKHMLLPFLFSLFFSFMLFYGVIQFIYYKSIKETAKKLNLLLDTFLKREV